MSIHSFASSLERAKLAGGSISSLRHSALNAFLDKIGDSPVQGIIFSASNKRCEISSCCFLRSFISMGIPRWTPVRFTLLMSCSCLGHLSFKCCHNLRHNSESLSAYSLTSSLNSLVISPHIFPFMLSRVDLSTSSSNRMVVAPFKERGMPQ